jgi:hypothetical protein
MMREDGRITKNDGSLTTMEDVCQIEDGCMCHGGDRSWKFHVYKEASVEIEKIWVWLTFS